MPRRARAPIFCCTRQAVEGNGMSGVMRGDDDQINLVGGDAGHFHRALGGLGGEVGGEFVRGGDAAFLDAGARGDPFVRGLDHFFKFGVGQDFFRHIRADAGDGAGAALKIVFGARIFEFGFHETAAELEFRRRLSNVSFARAISPAMIWLI